MRRFKFTILAFALLSMVVVQSVSSAEKTKVVLGAFANTDVTLVNGDVVKLGSELVRMFNATHPTIDLQYEEVGAEGRDIHTVIATMLASKSSTYDVFASDVVWSTEFPARNWYLALDDVFPKSEQAKYIPSMISTWTSNGHIYGVPWNSDFMVMFYRKDLLEAAGLRPPDTWDDLISICQKLQSPPDLYGFAAEWQLHSDASFSPMLWSAGGALWDKSSITVNGPEGLQAMQLMVDLNQKYKIMQPGLTSISYDETRNFFTEGLAIFHQDWLYVYNMSQLEGSKIKGKVGIMGIPRMSTNSPKVTPLPMGGWSWSANPFTKNKTATKEVIKWLASPSTQKWLAMYWASPCYLPLYNDPDVIKQHPEYALFKDLAPHVRPRFEKYDHFIEWLDRVRQESGQAILGKQTAKQAVNRLADTLSIWANLPQKYSR
jgi:multiple sugar transport system substrate-binding protein